jgi:diadenosine tetraphosphatase ApaH/serine/threonine PP2A family protein phosphatase
MTEVLLVWTFGFILNGAPNIRTTQPLPPMTMEECVGILHTDTDRMHDWLRGKIGVPLDSPVAVYGECHPVPKDATQKVE